MNLFMFLVLELCGARASASEVQAPPNPCPSMQEMEHVLGEESSDCSEFCPVARAITSAYLRDHANYLSAFMLM